MPSSTVVTRLARCCTGFGGGGGTAEVALVDVTTLHILREAIELVDGTIADVRGRYLRDRWELTHRRKRPARSRLWMRYARSVRRLTHLRRIDRRLRSLERRAWIVSSDEARDAVAAARGAALGWRD